MVAGMLMATGFLSLPYVIEVGQPALRKTRRDRQRNRAARQPHASPRTTAPAQQWTDLAWSALLELLAPLGVEHIWVDPDSASLSRAA